MHVELLWFSDCPNHEEARHLLREVLAEAGLPSEFEDVDATDPARATELRFAGSPSIRIDGVDVEPGFTEPGEYTPACRVYRTEAGVRGVPERQWVANALAIALQDERGSR